MPPERGVNGGDGGVRGVDTLRHRAIAIVFAFFHLHPIRSSVNRRAFIAAPATIAAGLLIASAAGPAFAASDDTVGANILWSGVDDSSPYISDAQSAYPNLLGSGVSLPFGWTADAFDGMFEQVDIDGTGISFTAAPGGAGWVDGGLSSFAYTGVAPGFDPAFEIAATLEVQGNYARWTFTPVAGPTGTLTFSGNLGSDDDQTATVVTANSAVVSSDDNAADPVIGYWFSGAAGTLDVPDAADGSDYVEWSASTTAVSTAIIALQDYAPCAEATATSEMIARVATLNTTFGQAIEGALECAAVTAPAELTPGTAANQTLAVTIDPLVESWIAEPWQLNERDPYLSDPTVVGSAFVGGPAGVSYSFDPTTSLVTVSGTPTQSGAFDVALVLYLTDVTDYESGDAGNGYPLVAHFTVQVAAPALAATGASAATPYIAAFAVLLMLAGGTALVVRRRATQR